MEKIGSDGLDGRSLKDGIIVRESDFWCWLEKRGRVAKRALAFWRKDELVFF